MGVDPAVSLNSVSLGVCIVAEVVRLQALGLKRLDSHESSYEKQSKTGKLKLNPHRNV